MFDPAFTRSWYWCISPPPRNALDDLISAWMFSTNPVLKFAYDATWTGSGGTVSDVVYDQWVSTYGLTLVNVAPPPDPPILAYQYSPALISAAWVNISSTSGNRMQCRIGGFPLDDPYLPGRYPA